MEIVKSYLTRNPCYVRNAKKTDSRDVAFQKSGPKKLMLHSVGTPQPDAAVFVKNWNKSSYTRACVHAFISAIDGTVYQTLPWNYRGWHAGKSAGNNICVGVEMCEPSSIKYTGGSSFKILDKAKAVKQCKTAYDSAVELFARLCKAYKLDPLKDITSHYEGHQAGIASNHGDPRHLWAGLGMSYTMDGFRKDVAAKIKTQAVAEAAVKFKVVSRDGTLNVRSSAPNGAVIATLKTGQTVKWDKLSEHKKTINEVAWYYITKPTKNIKGWVSGKYLEKV